MRLKFSLSSRKNVMGMVFISPWFVGFVLLFLVPLIQTFQFSLQKIDMAQKGFVSEFYGLRNYQYIFTEDPTFNRILTESILNMLVSVPLIIFFSLFCATLINQKFRGRMLARAIFFLPVILTSGIIAFLDGSSSISGLFSSPDLINDEGGGNPLGVLLTSFELKKVLLNSGINHLIVSYLTNAVIRIYAIISHSGVQILIFLAGLQSIPQSLYESSKIEGATGYEAFWKITFPILSPLILTNVIYAIIDAFYDNPLTKLINKSAFLEFNFGVSSAMSVVYFLTIAILLTMITFFISRKVQYLE